MNPKYYKHVILARGVHQKHTWRLGGCGEPTAPTFLVKASSLGNHTEQENARDWHKP